MRENSAEERDIMGGGVESRWAQAKDPAEDDEERDILAVFPYCFKRVESRGEDFS